MYKAKCNTERNKSVIRNMDKENKLIEGRVSVNTYFADKVVKRLKNLNDDSDGDDPIQC